MTISAATKNLSDAWKMCSPSPIGKALDTMDVNKQHFLRIINFFIIIVFVFVCMTSWLSSHCVVLTYKYIYLHFSQRWFENESYREDMFFLNLISLLTFFALLYNLVFVTSVLSAQPRRKSKDRLARNQDNVFKLSYMSTISQISNIKVHFNGWVIF